MDSSDNASQAPATQGVQRTTLNRKWLTKMGIFIAALLALGVWGTYDALLAYPKRGREHAEFMKLDYLQQAEKDSMLLKASVEDPFAELKRLRENKESISQFEQARLRWLESLAMVHNLQRATADNKVELAKAPGERGDTLTMFKSPDAMLPKLKSDLASKTKPKPLSGYDIPSQYLFMLVGFAGAAWMGLFLLKTSRVKYKYDASTNTLTLPNGRSIAAKDIAEVDRRLWHKYFVFLKPADGSSEIKLDLLRFTPLEDWFLEMEKLHPGYQPEPAENPAEAEAPAPQS